MIYRFIVTSLFVFLNLPLLVNAQTISDHFDEIDFIAIDQEIGWPAYEELLLKYHGSEAELAQAYYVKPLKSAKLDELREQVRIYVSTYNLRSSEIFKDLSRFSKIADKEDFEPIQKQHHQYSPLIMQVLLEQTIIQSDLMWRHIPKANLVTRVLTPGAARDISRANLIELVPQYFNCAMNEKDCPVQPNKGSFTRSLEIASTGRYRELPQFVQPETVNSDLRTFIKSLVLMSYLIQKTGAISVMGDIWQVNSRLAGIAFVYPGINSYESTGPLSTQFTLKRKWALPYYETDQYEIIQFCKLRNPQILIE